MELNHAYAMRSCHSCHCLFESLQHAIDPAPAIGQSRSGHAVGKVQYEYHLQLEVLCGMDEEVGLVVIDLLPLQAAQVDCRGWGGLLLAPIASDTWYRAQPQASEPSLDSGLVLLRFSRGGQGGQTSFKDSRARTELVSRDYERTPFFIAQREDDLDLAGRAGHDPNVGEIQPHHWGGSSRRGRRHHCERGCGLLGGGSLDRRHGDRRGQWRRNGLRLGFSRCGRCRRRLLLPLMESSLQ